MCDVVFDEQAQWNWEQEVGEENQVEDMFTVEYLITHESLVVEGAVEATERQRSIKGRRSIKDRQTLVQNGGDHELGDGDHTPSRGPSIASLDLDADNDDQLPVHVKRLVDIVADVEE
jgi:hypothetical protein